MKNIKTVISYVLGASILVVAGGGLLYMETNNLKGNSIQSDGLPPEVTSYNEWRTSDSKIDAGINKLAIEKCNSIKTGSLKSFELVGKGYMEIDKEKLSMWADQASRSCDNSTATLDFQ